MKMRINAAVHYCSDDVGCTGLLERNMRFGIGMPGCQTIVNQVQARVGREGEDEVLWFDVAVDQMT